MAANIGYGALVATLIVSIYGIAAAIYGAVKKKPAWVESSRLAMLLTFPLITLSCLAAFSSRTTAPSARDSVVSDKTNGFAETPIFSSDGITFCMGKTLTVIGPDRIIAGRILRAAREPISRAPARRHANRPCRANHYPIDRRRVLDSDGDFN